MSGCDHPKVSVVIRTFNEALFLGRLLEHFEKEARAGTLEFVVVDSGSTDGTVEIARPHAKVLIEIEKKSFDYSTALNLGIEKSRGEFIVIISAHAIPREKDWLQHMIAPFDDAGVAGVYCRQVPWPDAYWREVVRLRRTFPEGSHVTEANSSKDEVVFSNAASCIRRELWKQQSFQASWAEDMEWAKWAVRQGHKIVYEAKVSVYHSHNESCRSMAKRTIQIERAADLRLARSRDAILTLRQALGYAWRDMREIVMYDGLKGSRGRMILRAWSRAFWFIKDFRGDRAAG